MKAKGEIMTSDGFDRNVAGKMPRIKQQEAPLPSPFEEDPEAEIQTAPAPLSPPEIQAEKKVLLPPFKEAPEAEPGLDVMGLIEDLHNQLLASSRAKRAMETDLASSKRAVQQLAQDNKDLRYRIGELNQELQRLKEAETETDYLQEENEDALDRIQKLQQELKMMKETLTRTAQEREDALRRIQELESQREENEVLWIKGRMKEKEASHFYEENQLLRSNLEKALDQNREIEGKYEALKKSFREVRESLNLLRDSCKASYYHLSETGD